MTREQLKAMQWGLHPANPLIRHSRFSPVLADPAVVPAEQAPDGMWRLYAHSVWGIHEYRSPDGVAWRDRGVAVWNAERPWVVRDGEDWCLLYEAYPPFAHALSIIPDRPWHSCIRMRRSRDLSHWGPPVTLLSPTLPWHKSERFGDSVGNPCLVKSNGRFRLYYSASLVWIPDCGFPEPQFIGVAEADAIEGPYIPREEPLMKPDPRDPWRNLGLGALRVMELSDGWAGFENGIYIDAATGKSGSAVVLLGSRDGLSWDRLVEQPIVVPGEGWMTSHVYAACPVERPDGSVLLYFNARDDWPMLKGRECIGCAVGRTTEARR